MLQYMQEFSQRLLSHTHEIQEQVDGLVHDAKVTNYRHIPFCLLFTFYMCIEYLCLT